MKKKQLALRMVYKGLSGVALLGALLFVSAGSFRYFYGWLFIAVLTALMLAMGVFLLIKNPRMLESRLNANETQSAQKGYLALFGLLFVGCFLLAGLDYRLQWSTLPFGAAIAAIITMVIGYALYAAVILQNAYASRVIAVQANQRVVSTGLYAAVRHPMYLSTLLLFLSMPIALGSVVALIPMLAYPFVIALRIKNEEAMLLQELDGYAAYMERVKYRLIPYIW